MRVSPLTSSCLQRTALDSLLRAVHSLKLQLGARTVIARCDPDLAVHAASVLELLGELASCGPALEPGAAIPLGWSRLSLEPRGEDLVVCEPRFDGDPFAETRDDITRTLAILVEQAALVEELGVASQPTPFDARLAVAVGALAGRRILVERRADGWFVGPADGEPDADLECEPLHVYELLGRRPAVLRVLALPVGYLAVLDGDTLETVLDDQDRELPLAS